MFKRCNNGERGVDFTKYQEDPDNIILDAEFHADIDSATYICRGVTAFRKNACIFERVVEKGPRLNDCSTMYKMKKMMLSILE